jgi:hypothetical protein
MDQHKPVLVLSGYPGEDVVSKQPVFGRWMYQIVSITTKKSKNGCQVMFDVYICERNSFYVKWYILLNVSVLMICVENHTGSITGFFLLFIFFKTDIL